MLRAVSRSPWKFEEVRVARIEPIGSVLFH